MIYIAGSLFSEAEVKQRIYEGKVLEERYGKDNVFNPITNPFNDKSTKPTAEDIFIGDYSVIRDKANVFIVNLDNPLDMGVAMELGQVLALREQGKDILVLPIVSDIRAAQAGDYDGFEVPWGINQYVIGALRHYGIPIYSSFEELIDSSLVDSLIETTLFT